MAHPDRRYPIVKPFGFSFERDYDCSPEPLPKNLVKFLIEHGVSGKVFPEMLWAIEPQIVAPTKTTFGRPKYREPFAEIDCTPEEGPLPRILTHYCLCPDGKDWFYLIALFFDNTIPDEEKLTKLLARLNEKPSS